MLDVQRRQEVARIASKLGTPAYVYWEADILSRIQRLKAAFLYNERPVIMAYSMKACFCPAIVQIMVREGLWLDCASAGEIYVALKVGVDPKRILYTSISKQPEELNFAFQSNVGIFSIDSFSDMTKLHLAAKESGKRANVLLRINPEIGEDDTSGHKLMTGTKLSKFGVGLWDDIGDRDNATAIIRKLREDAEGNLNFIGLHFHLGTGISSPSQYLEAIDRVTEFRDQFQIVQGIDLSFDYLNIGGGFSPESEIENWAEPISRALSEGNLDAQLMIEPGRYLVNDGVLVSKVTNIKQCSRLGNLVVVDAGYHTLLDSALLGQQYPVGRLESSGDTKTLPTHLVGPLCDSVDVFTGLKSHCYSCGQNHPDTGKTIELPQLEEGQHLIFTQAGAYSTVLNTQFNGQPLPAIALVLQNGQIKTVRRRSSPEQFFLREGGDLLFGTSDAGI